MGNIDERIKEVMANVFNVDIATLNEDSSQDNIESWDSMKHLDFIVSLEEEFDITIPIEEVGNMINFKYTKVVVAELAQ